MSKLRKSICIIIYMIIISSIAWSFMPTNQINVWTGETSDYGWGGIIIELLKLPILCVFGIIYMISVEFIVKKIIKRPNYIMPQIFSYVWVGGLIFMAIKHTLTIINQLGIGLPIDIIAPIITGIYLMLIGNNVAKNLISVNCDTLNVKEQRLQLIMYRSFRFLGYILVLYGFSLVISPLFNQKKIIFDQISTIGIMVSLSIWFLYTVYVWFNTKKEILA